MKHLDYSETPVVELNHPFLSERGIRLLIKREDLNHKLVSGNKWWKLKYNLLHARKAGFDTLLTFGGAFSNHIFATAAAAAELGFSSIGVIRGEEQLPLNTTLDFAQRLGMHLHFISRTDYRLKTQEDFITKLTEQFGKFFLIPEGGTNEHAIKGTAEFGSLIQHLPFDYVFVPVGTAGTLAGMVVGLDGTKNIVGVPVFKSGETLREDIRKMIWEYTGREYSNWSILSNYHHGGYAKTTPELIAFIREMRRTYDLPLDQVYSGKLLFAIFEELTRGSFNRGATILAIHTGGLQGAMRF